MLRYHRLSACALLGLAAAITLSAACTGGSLSATSLETGEPAAPPVLSPDGTIVPVTPGNPAHPTQPAPKGEEVLGPVLPGRVTIRRLNALEYRNTVRDLLGLEATHAELFPPDDFGYGFNNNGDVLSVSPVLFERYEESATALVEEVLRRPVTQRAQLFEAEVLGGSVGAAAGNAWNVWTHGQIVAPVEVAHAGRYRVSIRASGDQAGPDPARMGLSVERRLVHTFDVTGARPQFDTYTFDVTLPAGTPSVAVSFTNDFYQEGVGDRNLYVDWIEVDGPLDTTSFSTEARDRIMTCSPEDAGQAECTREIFGAFARRAWRRPITSAELDGLLPFLAVATTQGEGFDEGIALGLRAILLSPRFIFRPELDQSEPGTPHRLSQHELATRLAYFLWASTPDDTLLELADRGQLDDATLRAQVERMVADARANTLIDQLASQWLYTDSVLSIYPDTRLFPTFDENLKRSMSLEMRRFVQDFLLDDKDMRELMTADYSYLNARLARHYDVTGISGDALVRHTFEGEQRRGILTQGGLLSARSFPTRTSPVKRGEWVLQQLLCSAPPAPPPGVESIDDGGASGELTLRERLEQHRSKPQCIACHATMDPIGFGLEHYDATGAWRETDNGKPVDALGELPDGRTFLGAHEMAEIIANDPLYPECLAERVLTYATGRGFYVREAGSTRPTGVDAPQIKAIATKLAEANFSSRELLVQIVLSDAFRMRVPEEER